MIDNWSGSASGGAAFLERPRASRFGGMYSKARAEAQQQQAQTAPIAALKQKAGQELSEDELVEHVKQLVPHTSDAAKRQSLMLLTKRIDENAFRVVDYAAIYISTRNAHLEAVNDLVLSMGPYLTALKAYSTALKSYSAATLEKSKHILALRDMDKNQKILNDAKAVIAFNELKAGSRSRSTSLPCATWTRTRRSLTTPR